MDDEVTVVHALGLLSKERSTPSCDVVGPNSWECSVPRFRARHLLKHRTLKLQEVQKTKKKKGRRRGPRASRAEGRASSLLTDVDGRDARNLVHLESVSPVDPFPRPFDGCNSKYDCSGLARMRTLGRRGLG